MIKKLFILFLFLILPGCGTTHPKYVQRADHAYPARFGAPQGLEFEEFDCKNPLIDPEDGTELILIDSSESVGNYRPPAGKYGLAPGELLQINCQTGEVIGVIKR